MDLQLNTKTAIVTAATAGIGLAIARTLAQEGVAVTITGRDHKKLAAPQNSRGGGFQSTVEGVAALTAQQPETDILINNLGFYEATPFADITDEAWLRMFDVNVMSGVRLSRHYFPQMLTKNWGRVIFISSEVGAFTPPDMVHYGMSKSAQLAVARGMAELTKGTGVTVNSVLPSATRSEGIMEYLRQTAPQPGMTDAQIEANFFATYRPSSLLRA
ncbi:Dehydrogenases with different specificities (related to short-chain alcohol dehydrogenases) [Cronobacter sakazakii 696]|nr:Dehydrogenases with different specificities (related to short-chain alcohol dehydrogenases) [Cronobacter sakazakii 696]